MGERLKYLPSHDVIILLCYSFAIPKLLYTIRTSPCFLSPELQEYDNLLRSIVSGIVNIHFDKEDPTWTQATLPVKNGGLEIRSAVQLALSAYLASAAACSELVFHILPPQILSSIPTLYQEEAKIMWFQGHDTSYNSLLAVAVTHAESHAFWWYSLVPGGWKDMVNQLRAGSS